MIEVHNLQKQFGAVAALRDVSFRAPDGAITGLLGANGAGKSTTLRTICGVLKPGSGEVRVDGISPVDDPLALQRRVGGLLGSGMIVIGNHAPGGVKVLDQRLGLPRD